MQTISRPYLEGLKRPDLQKLCKDYGVKANLKSDALIELILDSQNQPFGGGTSAPAPAPTAEMPNGSSTKPVSKLASKPASHTSPLRRSDRSRSRARNHSATTVVVHEEATMEDVLQLEEQDEPMLDVEPEPEQDARTRPPNSRTRKAKSLHFKLGVGRPVAAGGNGARTVTKPPSVARGRRGGTSRSLPNLEPTITEEVPKEAVVDEDAMETDTELLATEQIIVGTSANPIPVAETSRDGYLRSLETLREDFSQKLDAMKRDFETLHHTEVDTLRDQVQTLSDQLTLQNAKSASLEIEIRCLKAGAILKGIGTDGTQPRLPVPDDFATPPARSSNLNRLSVLAVPGPSAISASRKVYPTGLSRTPGSSAAGSSTQSIPGAPGPSAVAIGKRPRVGDTDDMSGAYEASEREALSQEEIARKVVRSDRKRSRSSRSRESSTSAATSSSRRHRVSGEVRRRDISDLADTSAEIPARRRREPAFIVFTGPEEAGEAPSVEMASEPTPIQAMPDSSQGRTTSTAHQTENQNPFNFGFGAEAEQYPYLDPPGSPTPAPPVRAAQLIPSGASYGHTVTRAGGRRERNDLFHPFGTPPPPDLSEGGPAPTRPSVPPSGFLGSAAELRPTTPPARLGPSSNDIGAGLGMTALPPDTPAPPMKRTMYGTELEGDTRFGDFGVEGVATGFWAGGRF